MAKTSPSILADAMEAVIGAMYMSTDLETTRSFIERIFGPLIAESAQLGAGTRLEDIPAGTFRRTRARCSRVPGHRHRTRSRQGIHRECGDRRRRSRNWTRSEQEGR